MRAVLVPAPGGAEALVVADVPAPRPGAAELLVTVRATAVNRADVLQRQGRYPPPKGASAVLGLEVAGTVAAVGDEVTGWAVGDRVCGVVTGGGYAEQAVLPAAEALPVPATVDLVEAAAVPEVFTTAYDNLLRRGRLAPGETALVHGAGSGVGTAAVQLGKRRGARVLVTAGSDRKLAACAELGADHGINYRDEDFVEAVAARTDRRGAEVILDIVGSAYLARNLSALALEGRLVIIGLMGGGTGELDLSRLMARRLTVAGSTLRARGPTERAELAAALRRDVWPGFDDGSLRPVIDRVLPLERVAEAHRVMEAGEHIGKIVLTV